MEGKDWQWRAAHALVAKTGNMNERKQYADNYIRYAKTYGDRTPAPKLRGLVFCGLAEGSATRHKGIESRKERMRTSDERASQGLKPSFRDFLHPIFDLFSI